MGKVQEMAESTTRLPQGALDDLFVEYYLETASNTEAYTRACNAGGHEFNENYAAQYGRKMYKRLAHKISEAIDTCETEDAALARMALRNIIIDTDASDQAVIAAAKELARKRVDKIEIKQVDDISTIDAEILSIERALKANAIEAEIIEDCTVNKDDLVMTSTVDDVN